MSQLNPPPPIKSSRFADWLTDFYRFLKPAQIATTPAVTAGSGSFTTVSAVCNHSLLGDRVLFDLTVTITTNGTAASYVEVALPFTAKRVCGVTGVEVSATAKVLSGTVNGSVLRIRFYDQTYPGANGRTLCMTGVIPV